MHAIILSIGDELVLGQTVDTNSAYLSAELVRLGIGTLYHQTVADDRATIADAILRASKAGDLVIITGGLGPTDDDLTRDAMADAMGVKLVLHEPSLVAINEMFTRRGRVMAERNKVQALHPEDTTIIPNTCGTAPGIKTKFNRAIIYVTPGVPSEMVAMFKLSVLPEVTRDFAAGRSVILTTKLNTFGMGESTVAEKLGPLMDRKRNPIVGTTVAGGVVSVQVRSEFADPAQAKREMDDTLGQIEAKLGAVAYGRDEDSLAMALLKLLKEKNQKLATAESCTGGLLGAFLTDVPGSSAAYLGGWITYANAMKAGELGVPASMLQQHGAVSQEVARSMAIGALHQSNADWALAITGIAGPDGGTKEKPVGLVWIALAGKDGTLDSLRFDLGGERDIIRDRSAKSAMQLLRLHLLGGPVQELTFGRRVLPGAGEDAK